jgi:hypothetical protein
MSLLSKAVEVPHHETHAFLLQRVQPALTRLIEGSLSTLAPIFAVALATQAALRIPRQRAWSTWCLLRQRRVWTGSDLDDADATI